MKARQIKAKRWLQNDMTGEIYRSCAPWQKRFAHGVYVIPSDAASYERMVRQMTRPWMTGRYQTTPEMIRASLRAIGITAPKKGRK